jgi:hypothetical protein
VFDVNAAGLKQVKVPQAPIVNLAVWVVAVYCQSFFVTRVRCALRTFLGAEPSVSLPADAAASVRIVRELNAIAESKILKGSASME